MKKLFTFLSLVITALVLSISTSMAVPAYSKPVSVTQPDGTQITLKLIGDEFFHYKLTSDGYQVVQGSDGYYYYYTAQSASTKLAGSGMRASDPNNRTAQEQSYLRGMSTGVNQEFYELGVAAAKIKREMLANQASLTRVLAPTTSGTMQVGERGIIILAEFQDVKFQSSHTKTTFERLVNEEGYSDNGAIGSARDYYIDNSLGVFTPTFTVSSIVTLPENREYYGGNDDNGVDLLPAQMILDACIEADSEIDFSQFDTDGDGYIDNVFVFYAGHNEAEHGPEESVWPHKWSLYPKSSYGIYGNCTGSAIFDGVTALVYSCTSELKGSSGTTLCGISTFAHEFGHVLGLPDFYDCDYDESGGETVGLYNISIMSSGNYNSNGNIPPYYSVLEREIIGWNTPVNLATVGDEVTLYPVHTKEGNNGYYLNTDQEGEIFMFESRKAEGWDAPLGTSGLLIYQVDRSTRDVGGVTALSRWTSNTLNDYYTHPCARFIESSGVTSSSNTLNKIFYPGSSNNSSFKEGDYGFESWNGVPLSVNIVNISNNNGTVTLQLSSQLELGMLKGSVKNSSGKAVADAEITLVSTTTSTTIYSTTSDENGEYSFNELICDTYTLSCSALNYSNATIDSIAILHNETTTQEIVLEDAEKHSVNGKITSQDKTPLSGVTVVFELISTDYSNSNRSSSVPNSDLTVMKIGISEIGENSPENNSSITAMQRSVVYRYEATTNQDGEYSIDDLLLGTYTVSFSLDGYHPYSIDNQILDGSSTLTIDGVLSTISTELMSYHSWSNQYVYSAVSAGSEYSVACEWQDGELGNLTGKNLEALTIYIYNGLGLNTTAKLYINGNLTETVTQTIGGELVTFNLSSRPFISSNTSVRVEYSIPDGAYAAIDNGDSKDGKGNLISLDQSSWTTLKSNNIAGNWVASLLYNKGSNTPDTPVLEIGSITQTSFILYFQTTDANIESWTVRFKPTNSTEWTEATGTWSSALKFNNLSSGTSYDIEVTATFMNENSSASISATTLSTTAPFAAISGISYTYNVGDTYYCELTNLSESTTSVVWYLDSSAVDSSNTITFSTSGAEHTVKCVITYESGRVETLRRKVLVK